jgi:hypothetical protein
MRLLRVHCADRSRATLHTHTAAASVGSEQQRQDG